MTKYYTTTFVRYICCAVCFVRSCLVFDILHVLRNDKHKHPIIRILISGRQMRGIQEGGGAGQCLAGIMVMRHTHTHNLQRVAVVKLLAR